MLRKNLKTAAKAGGARFAIIASKYNARYVDAMLNAARKELQRAKAIKVIVVRVPGAFEIPVVAATLARRKTPLSAIICLGVILRGATTHASHIGEAVTQALVQIQVDSGVPVIHEVLLLENEQQAVERCLSKDRSRGVEAAQTAVAMALTMRKLRAE